MGFKLQQLLVEKLPEEVQAFMQFPGTVAELKRDFAGSQACFVMAYDENTKEKVIGMGGFRDLGEEICEIKRMVVGWNFQKMGVGRQLLEMLMKQAMVRGYRKMRVLVPIHIPDLIRFYQKMGFVEIQSLGKCTSNEFTAMELTL